MISHIFLEGPGGRTFGGGGKSVLAARHDDDDDDDDYCTLTQMINNSRLTFS